MKLVTRPLDLGLFYLSQDYGHKLNIFILKNFSIVQISNQINYLKLLNSLKFLHLNYFKDHLTDSIDDIENIFYLISILGKFR